MPLPCFSCRSIVVAATLALFACHAGAAYPDRPIKLIVPTTAGSVPDVVARLLGERLTASLGQPVVIDNRPGGGGTIGLVGVSRAAPDGYTLGVLNLPYVIAPIVAGNPPYDTERDLVPVAMINWNYAILVARASTGMRSVDELVAAARARPGQLKYSSQGLGTPGHLALKLLERHARIELLHVPYKGGPAAVTAVLSGEVDLQAGGIAALGPHIESKALRPLATLAPQRLSTYPDVPSMKELGYDSVQLSDWQGIVAPSATPREVIARLEAEMAKVVASPEFRARLEVLGMKPAGLASDEFANVVRDEVRRWGRLVRELHITAE